jgi:preprotein translocase subunit SecG
LQLLVNIILVVNVFVCVALVAVVLLQRSEGGALGMGGGGGGGNFMTAAGAGDLLTRTTWVLAFVFFFLSITETILTGKLHGGVGSLVDHINTSNLDLTTPQKPAAPTTPLPATSPSAAPAPLQAPAPQTQGNNADALSILAAPTIQSKSLSAPAPAQQQAPAPAPAPAPEKK